MSNTPIELKGSSFTLSVVHLHDANPEVIRQALEDKIAQAPAFLRHAPVVVNISSIEDDVDWRPFMRLSPRPVCVLWASADAKSAAENRNRPRRDPFINRRERKSPRPAPEPVAPPPVVNQITKTRLIDQPVRSGQRIYAPHCDLIVTNHVSAGAELIADGNIHVYGMMRGRALAGAGGDRDAQIFCTTCGGTGFHRRGILAER
jgi:septum site-determining protein MinC